VKKIAQNEAQPVFVKTNLLTWRNAGKHLCYFCMYLKNCIKENNRLMGEISPNLVTLKEAHSLKIVLQA
jgi:hypothetical protein